MTDEPGIAEIGNSAFKALQARARAEHAGNTQSLLVVYAVVLDAAYARHPERFVRNPPTPPKLPTAVWINKPKEKEAAAH